MGGILRSISAATLGSLLLCGCGGGPSVRVEGTWRGMRPESALTPEERAISDDVVRGNRRQVRLTFLPDRRFELFAGSLPMAGSWVPDGDRLELRVDRVFDRPSREVPPLEFRVRDASRGTFRDDRGLVELAKDPATPSKPGP